MRPATFSLRTAVPILSSRLLDCFATDELTDETRASLQNHIRLSLDEAAFVQCVGMNAPVALLELYQPTKFKNDAITLDGLLFSTRNSIVFAGPGQEKTTFLKYLLLTQIETPSLVPILFTLRTGGSLDVLSKLVEVLGDRRRFHRIPASSQKFLLLVDGYDEISDEERKRVSNLLQKFAILRAGCFVLACRSSYSVYAVHAHEVFLADFDRDDAIRFVDAFAAALRVPVSGEDIVKELEQRQLMYIASHPLMLTLACVVKSRATPQLPHNAIELLRQAIETLTFRWDEGKGVSRASETGLISLHVLECTMRIAHEVSGLKVPMAEVLGIVRRFLVLLHRSDILPEKVVDEIRRFFGLLATTPDGQCQFVHKTIHDYLAARFGVENGLFQPARISTWDMRAAYSACIVHDATQSVHMALVNSRSVEAVRECLINGARFDVDVVAGSVYIHFDKYREDYTHSSVLRQSSRILVVSTRGDFFDVADDMFLTAVIKKGHLAKRTTGLEVVLAFCVAECGARRRALPNESRPFLSHVFQPYGGLEISSGGRTEYLTFSAMI